MGVFCQSLSEVAVVLKSNAAMANNASGLDVASDQSGTDSLVPDIISYYPKDDFSDLNPWMLATIGIGCVFIAFVGVSIYLMCKSTNQESFASQRIERRRNRKKSTGIIDLCQTME